ncbi:MAG: outer membrane beta-barrel protein [Caulobacteraceae bacterium]|nr:outer membrane beta-barrel protein [Caulobacteraceae bacterium]
MTGHTRLSAILIAASVSLAGAASAQDWTGPYVTVALSGDLVDDDEGEITLFDTDQNGTFGDTVRTSGGADAFSSSPTQSAGFCGGKANANNFDGGCQDDDEIAAGVAGRIGWDWAVGGFVFGVLGEAASVTGRDHTTAFSITPANYQFARGVDGPVYSARVRVGAPMGRWMPYATAGYAVAEVEETYSTTNAANSFTPLTNTSDADGFQVGGGLEYAVTDRVRLGAEYLYTALDVDDPLVVRVGPGTAPLTNPFRIVNPSGTDTRRQSDEFNHHAFRLTVSARF